MEQPGIKELNVRSQPSMNVKTVHKQNGGLAIGNSPYAETKEQMSGVFIFNCKDLDESLEYAWKLPAARLAIVEIHRLLEFSSARRVFDEYYETSVRHNGARR